MSHFQPGHVVELSSGECDLTIEKIDQLQPDDIPCVWFNMTLGGLPNRVKFPRDILKLKESQGAYPVFIPLWEIKIGDVVKLRSGGPRMTIVGIHGSDFTCTWFDQNQRDPLSETFSLALLVRA